MCVAFGQNEPSRVILAFTDEQTHAYIYVDRRSLPRYSETHIRSFFHRVWLCLRICMCVKSHLFVHEKDIQSEILV